MYSLRLQTPGERIAFGVEGGVGQSVILVLGDYTVNQQLATSSGDSQGKVDSRWVIPMLPNNAGEVLSDRGFNKGWLFRCQCECHTGQLLGI